MQNAWQWVLLGTCFEVNEQTHHEKQLVLGWSFELDYVQARGPVHLLALNHCDICHSE